MYRFLLGHRVSVCINSRVVDVCRRTLYMTPTCVRQTTINFLYSTTRYNYSPTLYTASISPHSVSTMPVCTTRCAYFNDFVQIHAPCGAGAPLFPSSPCPFTSSSFPPFYFSLSFIGFTYFLLLSIPPFSTRIVPLRFQAGGRRRRLNLGLTFVFCCLICVICIP